MDEVEKNKTVEKDMKKLVNKSWFRYWLSAEMSNSYERLQSLSFCYSIIPVFNEFRLYCWKGFSKIYITTGMDQGTYFWNKYFRIIHDGGINK